jgi:hypothetical protein
LPADENTMTRHPVRLAGALTLLMSGLAWIVNSNPLSGPTVVTFSETHGVHTNDWLTFALWAAAIVVAFPTSLKRLRSVTIDR